MLWVLALVLVFLAVFRPRSLGDLTATFAKLVPAALACGMLLVLVQGGAGSAVEQLVGVAWSQEATVGLTLVAVFLGLATIGWVAWRQRGRAPRTPRPFQARRRALPPPPPPPDPPAPEE